MPFIDIFSKSKAKLKPKPKITIDHREKNSLVVSELARLDFEISFEQLPVADYLIDNIAIERKTISDLKSSIINKRIMQQLIEIKQYPKHLLIIEGLSENMYNGAIHENALRGFLISVALNYRVPIVYTLNERDTAKFLEVLAKKSPKQPVSLRPSKFTFSDEEQLQFILEGFPGIGPVTAKRLLEHFHTIKELANAEEEEISNIIGKKAQPLYRLFRHIYSTNT